MGMYDTINGEQVKCFPWVSLYNDEITYHGGDLKYYGNRDEVPYRKPHYNYGKNFIILDFNRFPESEYDNYDYVLHIIVDGKVKKTFKDKIGRIDWANNEMVVGYYGELLNINSNQEVLDFIEDQREYRKKYDVLNAHWNELFKESMKYFTGFGLLDKDSEESKIRRENIEKLHELMDKERERIQPSVDALDREMAKWFVDTSNIKDLIDFGDYISAYNISYLYSREEQEQCKEMIYKMLQADSTLYDRYVAWQGTDESVVEFVQDKKE